MGAGVSHPINGQHYLLNLPPELHLLVLDNLPLQDIPNFSRSCAGFNSLVGSYLWSKLTPELLTRWNSFVSTHTGLLTRVETLVKHVSKVEDVVDRRDMYRLLSLTPVMCGVVARVSCAEGEVVVTGNSNPDHVKLVMDHKLCRKVVLVDRVRWLKVAYNCESVKPGKYLVSIRLRLEKNFTWPHTENQPSVWSLKYPLEDGDDNIVLEVDRKWWKQIWRGQVPGGRLAVEREDDWVKIEFPEIKVCRTGSVAVDMRDTVCNYWKGGISFDYIQLRTV